MPSCVDRLATVRGHFDGVAAAAGQGRLLRDGMTVVLAGRPNAGQVQPAQPPRGLRRRDRHGRPGHHARRAARTHRHRRPAAARARHRRPARLRRHRRARGRAARRGGDGARGPRAVRDRHRRRSRQAQPSRRSGRGCRPTCPSRWCSTRSIWPPGCPLPIPMSGPPRIHVSAATGAGLDSASVAPEGQREFSDRG